MLQNFAFTGEITLISPPPPLKYLKSLIFLALRNLREHPEFKLLRPGDRDILEEVIKRINVNAGDLLKIFYFSRKTVAEKIGVCRETISRGLGRLEAAGYVERMPQERRPSDGYKSWAPVRVTHKLLIMLGVAGKEEMGRGCDTESHQNLIEKEQYMHKQSPGGKSFAAGDEEGGKGEVDVIVEAAKEKMGANATGFRNKEKAKEIKPFDDPDIRILRDEFKLKDRQIFFLMGKSSANNQRLSHIVYCVKKHLAAIGTKSREIIAYLTACINSGKNYHEYRAYMEEKEKKENEKRQKNEAEMAKKAAELADKEAAETWARERKEAEKQARAAEHDARQNAIPIWGEVRQKIEQISKNREDIPEEKKWHWVRKISGKINNIGEIILTVPNTVWATLIENNFGELIRKISGRQVQIAVEPKEESQNI